MDYLESFKSIVLLVDFFVFVFMALVIIHSHKEKANNISDAEVKKLILEAHLKEIYTEVNKLNSVEYAYSLTHLYDPSVRQSFVGVLNTIVEVTNITQTEQTH